MIASASLISAGDWTTSSKFFEGEGTTRVGALPMIVVVGGRRPLAELADSGARRGLGNEPCSLTTGETPTWRSHVSAAWAWSERPCSPVGVTGMATRRGLRTEGDASQWMEKGIVRKCAGVRSE